MRSLSQQSGTSWSVHRLKSRGILELKGPDTVQFLQGLVTNEVTELEDRKVQFTMLLNAQVQFAHSQCIYGKKPQKQPKDNYWDIMYRSSYSNEYIDSRDVP